MKLPFQLRQDELGNAGVHLSHERTDADGTDDEPGIAINARYAAERHRLAPYGERAGSAAEGSGEFGLPCYRYHLNR
jgi:hypothetical protein